MSRTVAGFRRWSRFGAGWIVEWRPRRGDRHRLRPGLMELEARRLLATFTVTSTADDGSAGTLRSVIAEATATLGANTIVFDATVFSTPRTIALGGSQLELSNTGGLQTITGPAAGVTVNAGGQSRVFQVNKGVTASISGLTITGGSTTSGGGGLLNDGTVYLTDCAVSSNKDQYSGGGLWNGGTATLTNCTISGNSAADAGGLYNKGTVTLTDCPVRGNDALDGYGGGLRNLRGTMSLSGCTVSGNVAGGFDTGGGGGLENYEGALSLTDCTLSSNFVGYNESGGGLENASGTAVLTDCTILNNSSEGAGGGLSNGGTANLTNCTVSGNSSCGLWNGGTANLTNCTVSGNSSGGLLNGGTATLTNCTISGNSRASGGGLDNYHTATLTNCTVSGNSATNGGALYNNATMYLTACTVSGNSASTGGGLDNDGTATLTNTIVAGNTLPNSLIASDISGTKSVSGSYNLLGTGGQGGLTNGVNGNIFLPNLSTLGLAPLGFYGGPTQTMALLPNSAAIGKGTGVSGVTTDQRGEPLDVPTPDIGAFQATNGATMLVVNTTADGTGSSASGELSLRQAINLANVQDVAETITFDSTVFATAQTITLTQGPLELSDSGGTLTITGPKAGLIVNAGGTSGVFTVDSGVTAAISGLTITGGSTGLDGGGLYNKGNTTLTDCTISGNSAKNDGGGIGGDGSTTLINCTISGNSANDGGGLAIGGTASLTGCTISGNSVSGNGGGLYNKGTATLQDTIVAGNTGSGGSASDIDGSVATSSSYNLTGTGGSGGLSPSNHNLLAVADPGLSPLGEYGGPTETMALLPGSAAIGAGTAASGLTADQRGAPRPTSGAIDIGAFQDQGYTVAVSSGSGQSTMVGQAFGSPIVAELIEKFAGAPLPGVTIDFGAPSSGAGATLSADSAVSNAIGLASVTATANATAGKYVVTASATGVASSASFNLTNQIQPAFSGLNNQTVTYGSTVTLTGTLAAGSQVPQAGETVAITLAGVMRTATIGSDGSFSVQFSHTDVALNARLLAYNVAYAYAGDGVFLAAAGSSQLTVNPAPLTITAVSVSKVYGGALPALTASYSGFVAGDTAASLTTPPTLSTSATASSPVVSGGYPITASGAVDPNYAFTYVPGTLTITPAKLTITPVEVSKVYGAALPALTASYSGFVNGDTAASLSTPPSLSTTATASSPVVTGGYQISAAGAADPNYTFTYATGTVTVTPAPLTITAADLSKLYGAALPTLTLSYSGFVNGDTAASLSTPPSLSTTATASSPVVTGGYPIMASGAVDPNYTFTDVSGTLTVNPVPLTVTAKDATKVYGAALPAFTATYSGFVNGDTAASLTTAPSFSTKATAASPVLSGGYAIAPSGAVDPNYTFAYATGTLTITRAPLTIAAADLSKVYGAALPTLTASYSGFVAGDTAASLTTAPSLSTTATASSPVVSGGYAIAASGAADPNYTITYATGTLMVTPAPLTITALDFSKVYGAAVPSLRLTYSGFVNGDTASSLATPPTLSTAATASSPVRAGGYPITASGAVDPNYAITDVPGTLTVTPATPVLSVSAPGGPFDGSPFAASVTIAGTGNQATPAASLEDVAPVLTYYDGSDTSGTQLGSTPPVQPGTYTVVASFPGSTDYTPIQSSPATFHITASATGISLDLSSGSTVFGQAVTMVASIAFGTATPGGSVTFYEGTTPLGTVAVDGSGSATLATTALAVGSHSITAAYGGDLDVPSGMSGASTESVSKAATQVVLVPQPVFRKKKLVSLGLKAEVQPTAPGAGVPTGTLTFEIQKKVRKKVTEKVLGTMSLSGGSTTLSVKPNSVLKEPITIVYGGDADFTSSTSPTSVLTSASLKSLARPMVLLYGRAPGRSFSRA